MILHIYADYDKRIGAYKIAYILGRDYGICISVGRVYRLMRSMQLPPMSTIKPKSISRPKESSGCYADHLHQDFHQKAPNLVWTSDFTYLKAGGKWYYLCIIMVLFFQKDYLLEYIIQTQCRSGHPDLSESILFQKLSSWTDVSL